MPMVANLDGVQEELAMLNPQVDFAFKRLFGSEDNQDLLIALINSIVSKDDEVASVELLNPQNDKRHLFDKYSVLDIKARDQKGHQYNIEMQLVAQPSFPKRSLFYWAWLYTDQLKIGQSFDTLKKTICINILNFNLLKEESDYHNIYRLHHAKSGRCAPEFSDLELHFVELEKFSQTLPAFKTALERWLSFLTQVAQHPLDKLPSEWRQDRLITKAVNVLERLYLEPWEREMYEGRLKQLRDAVGQLKGAKAEGRAEGRAEALAEGYQQGRVVTAKNLLKTGAQPEFVSKVTEMPLQQVQQWLASMREKI